MALLSPPFTSSSYLYCSPHPFRFTAHGSSSSTAHHSRLPPISTAHSLVPSLAINRDSIPSGWESRQARRRNQRSVDSLPYRPPLLTETSPGSAPDEVGGPLNAPPPKETKLGITQSIALQRIEAEKKRHDDRRGYSRPENANLSLRSADDSYNQPRREGNRFEYGRYKDRTGSYNREHYILSRTARSNAAHYRNQRPSMQYRVVDKSRLSSGSSTPHQVSGGRSGGLAVRTSPPNNIGRDLPRSNELTPTRSLKDRLGPSSDQAETNSGSKERRSALQRISEPATSEEPVTRRTPSFESGRLQHGETRMDENDTIMRANTVESPPPDRIPATLRLCLDISEAASKRGSIPVSSLSKAVSKRRVTKIQKRVVRSPILEQARQAQACNERRMANQMR
ncbi:hypothetical protein YC2023_001854 [Brassica napus]